MTYEEARDQIIKIANSYLDSVRNTIENTVETDVLLRVIAEEITRERDGDEDEGPWPDAMWYDTSAELC